MEGIKCDSFELFTSPLITSSPWYKQSNKILSTSYRYEGDNEVFACYALRNENSRYNELYGQNGCKVLGFFFEDGLEQAKKDQVYNGMIIRLAISIFRFNYFWFDVRNLWAKDFLTYLQESPYSYSIVGNHCFFLYERSA